MMLSDYLAFIEHSPTNLMLKKWYGKRSIDFDMVELDSCYKILADIPGFGTSDIEISLDKNLLTISAKKSSDHVEDKNYLIKERKSESFTRSFRVQDDMDTENIEAIHRYGVLHITIPKTIVVTNKKKIPIKT
jgi:HSP20 family protein